MRKLTEGLIVVAFLLCAFTAQAATGIDVSIPSAGEACSNTLDCGPGELCVNDICSAARPCTSDLSCDPGEFCVNDICSAARPCTSDLSCDPGELCIDDICKQAECENDEDCAGGFCDSNKCVECRTWKDCDNETEICSDNNTCVLADDCDLKIKPKKIKIGKTNKFTIIVNKGTKKEKVIKLYKAFKLSVRGNENFSNPVVQDGATFFFDYDVSPLAEEGTNERWRPERRVFELVAGAYKDQKSGTYTLRFGKCLVDVEIENKNILPE